MPPAAKKGEVKHRCTACSSRISSTFDAKLHPLLNVLVCRKCHNDYGTGDFSQFNDPDVGPGVDEQGDDNYCRWCVDGGDLIACGNGGELNDPNRCHYAFCMDCIRRNRPDDEVLGQENFPPGTEYKWACYACEPDKLKRLKQEAQEIILALSAKDLKSRERETNSEEVQASKKRKTDSVSSTNGETINREPEASLMPPVAPPKQPESALRRLQSAKKSATPDPVKTKTNLPSSAPSKTFVSNLPSSINNTTKIKLPTPRPNPVQAQEATKINSNMQKPRPLSKQLKVTNEPIRPSCKVPLTKDELKKRMENYTSVKATCVREIDRKFQNVLEMFTSEELGSNRSILKFEIEDLERPLQEFTSLLRDLKSLYHSQLST